jgi:amino acid adenylation domain-containing protein
MHKPNQEKRNMWKAIRDVLKMQREAPPLLPISREGYFPLSFSQQRLWFLDQLMPDDPTYNLASIYQLEGGLDQGVLLQSIQEIVRRHDVLRTTFKEEGDEPVQIVHPEVDVNITYVDFRHLLENERELSVRRRALEELKRPFDLTSPPLFRVLLLQSAEQKYVLLLSVHHIVADGWSMNILRRELSAIYEAFLNDKPSPLPALPIQYIDFSQWQREWLQGDTIEILVDYWKQKLKDYNPLLELPLDFPRLPLQRSQGGLQHFALSLPLSTAIKALAQQENVTLFVFLQAALKALLHRYTRQTDILIGSPVANRNRSELKTLIGFFVNTLVLRTDLSGNPTFRELLQRVNETTIGAIAHQDLPFDQLVEAIQPDRALSHSPIFQVMFAFQNMQRQELTLSEMQVSFYLVDSKTTTFDLSLTMRERDGRVEGAVEYDVGLFRPQTMERMITHFLALLEGIVSNPEQHIAHLPLLAPTEVHQILDRWNETQKEFSSQCIHIQFEAQAKRTPDAIALISGGQSLSYEELNGRANQLAHYLRKAGVGPEILVGLCVDRSPDMIIGLLGILKTGGAYVPLDPAYPHQRIAFMLQDAGIFVLLTQHHLLEALPAFEGMVFCLDKDWQFIATESTQNLVTDVTVQNLAYMIYTSGSTGQPKGVMIQHNALLNYIHTARIEFAIIPRDRVLQFASISFDTAVEEIFPTLIAGATLVLRTEEMLESATSFWQTCTNWDITILDLPTAYWHELVIEQGESVFLPPTLRLIIIGGEKASPEKLKVWSENLNRPLQLLNTYGPTETTIVATKHDLSEISTLTPEVPIGKPIFNVQTYLLDDYLQPVPVGVKGELYIGGIGIARGYLNRPGKTAQNFIPDPFCRQTGQRLYKTGDIGRYLPDGTIEFVGRIDHQVKLRGFRIELGEIEAVLSQHTAVKHALLLIREDQPDQKRVVAYIVPDDINSVPTAGELHHDLQQKLPAYMLPSTFVILDRLPLTPNGKINYDALPVPNNIRPDLAETFVRPRTPVERSLAALWAELLGLEQVGIYDNFFELGGHSLLAIRIISRIRHLFQTNVPLRHLFETPTIVGLSFSIETAMRAEQDTDSKPPLVPAVRQTYMPLSFAQRRLWFLEQLAPNQVTYNIPTAVYLNGALNIVALHQSLNEIVRRHEILRTLFIAIDDEPVQTITPYKPLDLPIVDLHHLAPDERETEGQKLAAQEAQQPFNLSKAPLMRAKLIQLSQEKHIFLLTLHHIISDAWSIGLFMQELKTLYDAYSQGKPSPLPKLILHYADFAVWQATWLQGSVLDQQLAYWTKQLNNAPTYLQLPTKARPTIQTFSGASCHFTLSTHLTQSIKQLSREANTTLFMTLLGAFTVLLYRYTDQSDITIGTPVANRTQAEIESIMGFFVNTLVMRLRLTGTPAFRVLLQQVREIALEAYAHQDLPFEYLVKKMQPERDLSYSPLFQVMFAWQDRSGQKLELSGVQVVPLYTERTTAKFDLSLSMADTSQGISGVFEYNVDLFSNQQIEQMAAHFQTLLEGIVTNPDRALLNLPLLTRPEQHQIIVQNRTQTVYPKQCIHELFESQSTQFADNIAVVLGEESLTYHQLNQQANQLAHYLRQQGVGVETFVGICMERSLEMVVGILGILKAGGTYVPLDPTYPKERLAFMMTDTQTALTLTQARLANQLPKYDAPIVYVDNDWEQIASFSKANFNSGATAENLAYVMYTSGSTGQPKGIAIPHRAVARLVINTNYIEIEPEDRIAFASNSAFDAATFELWGALLHGARLVGVSKDVALSPHRFANHIREQGITTLFLTTALFNQMASEAPKAFQSIKHLMFGGEVVDPQWVAVVREHMQAGRLLHVYGPTESTTYATCYPVQVVAQDAPTVPIGRPIANTQVYILNRHMEPVPVGVPGELYIGGDGLARGYINQPKLTAEKFVPNPFLNQDISDTWCREEDVSNLSPDSAFTLYKTGDLVRSLPDGNIEFLGRIDNQVKLRGFRIELAEIEATLSQHPAVQDVLVLAREDSHGDKRLVAYVVDSDTSSAALRAYLQPKLPSYMIPATFIHIDKFPLTPNGKIDRNALPVPDSSRPDLLETYVPPQTPLENTLAEMWADVLGVQQVGIHDNFFELGGHSLLATRIISRIERHLDRSVSLRLLFETQTIAAFAQSLNSLQEKDLDATPPLPITRTLRNEPIPLSFAQQRLWFLDRLVPENPVYNIPMAVLLYGPLNVSALIQALNEILRRHEVLRTVFDTINDEPIQIITPYVPVDIPLINLCDLPNNEQDTRVQEMATTEAQQPFDLTEAPLLRATLLQLGSDKHVLLITMHHIVSDGWSEGVFREELQLLYAAFAQNRPSPLPELPIQYADFAIWQQRTFPKQILKRQLAYWQTQLKGSSTFLSLPVDKPRPSIQTFNGATHRFLVPATLSQSLTKLCQGENATLFMALLAAFSVLLYRYTKQDDINIGSPLANRNQAELEKLIGFFVNTLVIRVQLAERMTFRQLLHQVRETALEAYAHQDIPFELLVQKIQPDRDLSHSPLFQVMFVLQNAPQQDIHLSGLHIEPFFTESTTAKFDLSLSMTKAANGLRGTIEYNTDLFPNEQIVQMTRHFQKLLEEIVIDPDAMLSSIPLLTKAERQAVLVTWNDKVADYPKQKTLHRLFEQQAQKTPHAVAVVCQNTQLTYQELDRYTNQLAHYLHKQGVCSETAVGICVDRSLDLFVGLLGILKAGGVYVPLDPIYPSERLAFMMEEANIRLLLSQQNLSVPLLQNGLSIICLDTIRSQISRESVHPLQHIVTAQNLAYILFTSGSTGRPKGIGCSHAGISNLLTAFDRQQPIQSGSRCSIWTSPNFDVSIYEIFSALSAGGTAYLVPEEIRSNSLAFCDWLAQQKITSAYIPPFMLQDFAEWVQQHPGESKLCRLLVGVEPIPEPLLVTITQQIPNLVTINGYGPTEASICSTLYTVPEESVPDRRTPIGQPVQNMAVYLLDTQLNPVPVGVPGEIYIGGVGLARGYVQRPSLTAEHFIPNPFSDRPGERLYKSGDLARYLPDGNIMFIGRTDHQVKLHGFRIELAEIETILCQHAAVHDAHVIIREDAPGNKRLVAYLIYHQNKTQSQKVMQYLKEKLPKYMWPSALIPLKSFPITLNGKIDRQALPNPQRSDFNLVKKYAQPRDMTEHKLQKIWQEVLGVDTIGINDSFFDLGGYSLLVVRLIARIQQTFGQTLPLTMLFQNNNIAALATHLRQQETTPVSSSILIPMQAGEAHKRPIFLVHPVGGGVFCYTDLINYFPDDLPVYAFQAHGFDGQCGPLAQVETMAQAYLQLLRSTQPEGPYLLGGWSMGGIVAYEMAQQLQKDGLETELLILIDTHAPAVMKTAVSVDEATLLTDFARNIKITDIQNLNKYKQTDQRLNDLLEQAKKMAAIPPDTTLLQLQKLFNLFKSNTLASINYTPRPYSQTAILFTASDYSPTRKWDTDLGWKELMTETLHIKTVPGDHTTLIQAPNVKLIAQELVTYSGYIFSTCTKVL